MDLNGLSYTPWPCVLEVETARRACCQGLFASKTLIVLNLRQQDFDTETSGTTATVALVPKGFKGLDLP